MTAALVLAYLAVGGVGTVVVLTRDPARQVIVFGGFGLLLALLFLLLDAPDVALSEVAVGMLALPFMLLSTLTRVRRHGAGEDEG